MSNNIAFDVDAILALQLGEDFCQRGVDAIVQRRGRVIVVPSVLQELEDQKRHEEEEAFREVARKALESIPTWGFLTPSLTEIQRAIVSITATKICSFAPKLDIQSARVLAEASLLDCQFLLTNHMTWYDGVDWHGLSAFLSAETHLKHCLPIPPKGLHILLS
ncbi:hypothetical protein [Nibricoccus sp. IMCC34717]|uniref:hypothetical protein n=1 Tax=Nibricoccus sp. IMCC34717 TaxID=3034021 RepID=UPI00384E0003